jgi:trimeric autotransporter adhesin
LTFFGQACGQSRAFIINLKLGATMATFNGTSAANTINRSTSTAADLLNGLAGNDTLIGGNFNDTLDGGTGSDSMSGGLGNDLYIVGSTTDIVVEAAAGGNDTVQSSVTYSLNTSGAAQVENLTLTGTGLINATGNALANILAGNAAANLMLGLDGADTLLGLGGNDTLDGGNGSDSLDGGTGNDSMVGGAGDDAYVVDSATDKVVELAGGGFDRINSSVTLNLSTFAAEVESLILIGTAAINATGRTDDDVLSGNTAANVLTGLAGDDILFGGAGNDTLDGGEGNDFLIGGAGNDSMIGGNGSDTYTVDAIGDIVVEGVGLSGDQDTIQSSITLNLTTFAANVESLSLTGSAAINGTGTNGDNFILGNSAANILTGLGGNDSFQAGDGNDTIDGGVGNDTIDGGLGNDSMTGGAGDDSFTVNSVGDVVVEVINGGIDSIASSVSLNLATFAAQVENLVLTQTDAASDPVNLINGTGNDLANRISGNGAANVLDGGLGKDTLNGGAGDDQILGGAGDDSLDGGLGMDSMFGGSGIDTINGDDGNDYLNGGAERDVISGGNGDDLIEGGDGNDNLSGGAGDDILFSDAGDDVLTGGVGIDQMDSGEGNDLMAGGSGSDVYAFVDNFGVDEIFESDTVVGATNQDEVRFFSASYDTLWFSQNGTDLVIDQVGTNNSLTVLGWFNSPSAQIEVFYDDATGHQLNASSVANLVSTMAGFAPQVITDASSSALVQARDTAWITL